MNLKQLGANCTCCTCYLGDLTELEVFLNVKLLIVLLNFTVIVDSPMMAEPFIKNMSASNTLKDPCSACLVNKVGRTFHPSRVHSLPPQPHPSKVPGMATSPATVILVVDDSPDVPVVRPTILSSSTNSIKTFSQSFGQACKS